MSTHHPDPSPVYLGPAARDGGPGNKPIRRIVIHSTVSPCQRGGARNIARYFATTDRFASAHYVVDPGEVVQVVYDSTIAYHAPPNSGSLGVEMCEVPSQDLARWAEPNRSEMLDRTAQLVAELCLAYGVPVAHRGPIGLRLGRRGITTHANVGKAWGQTDHWDPGAWPRRDCMRAVRRYRRALRKARRRARKGN